MIPISDILHRGFVLSLASLSAYGIFLGVAVHRETLEKGRALMAKREEEAQFQKELEQKEQALAEAAQSVFQRKPS
jgi:glucose-6-phosphate-specific signal transduction histidine kinase